MKIKIKLITMLLSFFFVIAANAFCIPKWVPFMGGYCFGEKQEETVKKLYQAKLLESAGNQIKVAGIVDVCDYAGEDNYDNCFFGSDICDGVNCDAYCNDNDKTRYYDGFCDENGECSYEEEVCENSCTDGICELSTFCGENLVYENQSYKTVQIGTQCWMAENLNVGTKVVGSKNQTNNGIIEKYCYDDNESICNTDGGLYQWDEMMKYNEIAGAQGICSPGWHIPTDNEQHILDYYLTDERNQCNPKRPRNGQWGYCESAGRKLQTGAFKALIAGVRTGKTYQGRSSGVTMFWSSSAFGEDNAFYRSLSPNILEVGRSSAHKVYNGYSVRCIKD
jgi:uncharacterized protein (TIGR02145 family)